MTAITITLGNRPKLDADELRARAMRAADVLNGASWVFDEYVSDKAREFIHTDAKDAEKREILHHRINAAMELKQDLLQIIANQQAEETANARKHRSEPAADAE